MDARAAHPLSWTPKEWESWLEAAGAPRYRAGQIFQWLHQKGQLDPQRMTNVDKATRARLLEAGLAWPAEVDEVRKSADGTRKLLLRLRDGRLVECVLIPMTHEHDADVAAADTGDDRDDGEGGEGGEHREGEEVARAPKQRVTLCISTQVGCAMACAFCASGRAGLQRGLEAAEIVAQVLLSRRYLADNEQLRNLVFMGMGEPLHHYAETARALSLITDPGGLGMSPRRITVSTVGLVPGIRKLGRDFGGKLGLAISLHAPDDETRSRIMPINERYDIAALKQALREYPLPPRRKLTIEYTLIGGVNDSDEHAQRLATLMTGLRAKVNLIPMNPVEGSGFETPDNERVEHFHAVLSRARIHCSVRKRRGDEVSAACGQLALRKAGVGVAAGEAGLVPLERLSAGGEVE